MNITLKTLKIKDFAGIRDQEFNFNGQDARLYGDNATGKTTTALSLYWLLFDKGLDWKTVDIVPVDKNNQHIHELVPTVTAIFDYNGDELEIKRESHPVYDKVEGSNQKHYKNSRTTKQYIDEVPYKITAFKKEIGEIIDEDLFKLVTNPDAFPSLHWKDKRSTLFKMTGDVSDEKVIESKKELDPLKEVLEKRSIENHKKSITEKLKRTKDDLAEIPVKINTLNDQLDEVEETTDRETFEKRIEKLQGEKEQLERKRADIKNGDAILDVRREISEKRFEADNIKMEIEGGSDNKINGLKRNISALESDLQIFEGQKRRADQETADLQKKREQALKEYRALEKERDSVEIESFKAPDVDDKCPTCSQALPPEKIEEAQEKAQAEFNKKKSNRLESIDADLERVKNNGRSIADSIKAAQEQVEKIAKNIENTQHEIGKAERQLEKAESGTQSADDDDRYKTIQKEIEALEAKLADAQATTSEKVQEIDEEIQKVDSDLKRENTQLIRLESQEKIRRSIEEYRQDEDRLMDQIEDLKYQRYLVDEFTKTKVDLITEKVNSLFDVARFKLFHQQKDGDIKETCEIMVDGVTYDGGLNNAMRINVGLDIIQTLGKYFDVQAPIFIDNAEAVTDIKRTEAQQIELIVSESDKELRMERI